MSHETQEKYESAPTERLFSKKSLMIMSDMTEEYNLTDNESVNSHTDEGDMTKSPVGQYTTSYTLGNARRAHTLLKSEVRQQQAR